MTIKISPKNYSELTSEQKNFIDDKLMTKYKSEYNEYYFKERVVDTFESIGVKYLKELSIDYDTVRNNLYIDCMINTNNINLVEFIRAMTMYCHITNVEERELMEAINDPFLNIRIKYKYKSPYNYCDIETINKNVEELFNDKVIDFLDEVFDLLQSEFKETFRLLEDPDVLITKWQQDGFEIDLIENIDDIYAGGNYGVN